MLLGFGCDPLNLCQHDLVQRHGLDGVGCTRLLVLVVFSADISKLAFVPTSASTQVVLCSAGGMVPLRSKSRKPCSHLLSGKNIKYEYQNGKFTVSPDRKSVV